MSRRFDAGGCPIVATGCHVRCALRMTEARWSIDRGGDRGQKGVGISEKIAPSFRLQMETFFSSSLRIGRGLKLRYFSTRGCGNNRDAPARVSVRPFIWQCCLKKMECRELLSKNSAKLRQICANVYEKPRRSSLIIAYFELTVKYTRTARLSSCFFVK